MIEVNKDVVQKNMDKERNFMKEEGSIRVAKMRLLEDMERLVMSMLLAGNFKVEKINEFIAARRAEINRERGEWI